MFKQIKAKNLFSWTELEYDVIKGVSQISGYNYDDATSEGSGKSSIPNILCWTLYGKIPKDVKIDEVIKDGETSGWGEVRLSDDHSVIRGRKPNILKIITPQNTVIQGKDAKETQKLIEDLIGLSFDAFCQTVYFAQNYPEKFISSNETQKAAILSEVLDLKIFDRARAKVLTEIAITQAKRSLNTQKLALSENSFAEKNRYLISLKEVVREFAARKKQDIETLQNEILTNHKRMETLTLSDKNFGPEKAALEEALDEALLRLASANLMAAQYKTVVANYNQLLKVVDRARRRVSELTSKTENTEQCVSCGQYLPQEIKEQHALRHQNLLAEATAEVKVLEAELEGTPIPAIAIDAVSDLQHDVEAIKQALQDIYNQEKASHIAANNQKHLLDDNCKLAARILALEQQNTEAQEMQIHHIANELLVLQNNINREQKDIALADNYMISLEALKNGFKDVKKYVFQNMLCDLSLKATREASELFEVPINICFSNHNSEGDVANIETSVILDGQIRPLGLLSGGQYRRIELAVSIALAEILKNRSSKAIAFRIFDEPFKDLSESSMEKVVKLLEKLEGSTIIIEHNTITKSIITNEFFIEYRDGTSYGPKTLGMPIMRRAS